LTGKLDRISRLKTSRGIAAVALVVLLIISAAAGGGSGAAWLIVLSPLLWWLAWWVLGQFEGIWERLVAGSPLNLAVGRPWQSSGARKQLRQDENARLCTDRGGILMRERFWFIGSGTPPIRLAERV